MLQGKEDCIKYTYFKKISMFFLYKHYNYYKIYLQKDVKRSSIIISVMYYQSYNCYK